MELELRINGVIKSVEVAPSESLTNVLRREGYLSVRQGCETSECGACMVLVDGVPRPSCVMLAAQAGGCTVTTVEDLESAHQLNPLQDAFIEVGAIQCGFCTPGMLLSAQALLKRNPSPDEAEVREALSSNLCRCTGYARPVQAILRAAATLRGEKLPPVSPPLQMEQEPWQPRFVPSDLGSINRGPAEARSSKSKSGEPASKSEKAETKPMHVGLPERRVDAAKFATGRPSFTDDFERSGYLYARLLTSPHAHALIREINVSEAQDLSGVHAVLTYKDMPRVPHTTAGEPWPDNSPHDRFCLDYAMRYLGDRVAVVAAESPEIAEEALKLIEVDYELQPAIFDPRQALDARAPKIHSEPDSQKIYDASRNLAAHTNFEAGSIERGFKEAEQVIEADYLLPAIQQAPLERHSVMTYWDENRRLVVHTSTDAPFHIRRLLAEVTGLPPQRIKVVRLSVGGSFGSRQDLLYEDLCAQLTIKTNRPVKMIATRAEDLRDGGQRHSQLIHLKTGVKRDGRIVAQQALVLSSTGAYAAHAATDQINTVANLMALYPSANQRITAETAYTNLPPAGAFRGFGVAQGLFALESHMNEIAQQLKLDPLELRRRNWVRPGSENLLARELGAAKSRPLASSALPECLRLVEEKLGKQQADSTPGRFRKGKGFALAMYDEQMLPVGVSGASLSLSEDGSFQLLVGMADSVAGTDTLFAQVVAEALGVETSAVTVLSADTDALPLETNLKSSLALSGSLKAVRQVADKMRQQLLEAASNLLQVPVERLSIRHGYLEIEQGARLLLADVAMSLLYGETPHEFKAHVSLVNREQPTTFGAQGVEVEVDTETGVVRVLHVVSALAVGKLINPVLAEGQAEGAVIQALGQALTEELRYNPEGRLLTNDFSSYHLLRSTEVPALEVHFVKSEGLDKLGQQAVDDIAFVGIAPAVANAVANALGGVRIRQLPFTPERVLRAIHAHQSQPQQAAKR